jgi:hypothetical protein
MRGYGLESSAILVLMSISLGCAAAEAKEQREMIVRPNAKGQPQSIPRARNFQECVAGGMALGYPRVGPGGESDRRGAVGYCHSIGF